MPISLHAHQSTKKTNKQTNLTVSGTAENMGRQVDLNSTGSGCEFLRKLHYRYLAWDVAVLLLNLCQGKGRYKESPQSYVRVNLHRCSLQGCDGSRRNT